jgi:hypothetical protein
MLTAMRRSRREELGRLSGVLLEIDVGERLAVMVPHDETGVRLLGGQGGGKRRSGIAMG